MCRSLVAITMWMRLRLALFSASAEAMHVLRAGAGQAGQHRAVGALADRFGDGLDAFEVAGRGDGEAGFQHIDAKFGQRLGHADLLVEVHREAGRLLAIAQRGVEDDDAAVFQLAEAGMVDGHFGLSLDFDHTTCLRFP